MTKNKKGFDQVSINTDRYNLNDIPLLTEIKYNHIKMLELDREPQNIVNMKYGFFYVTNRNISRI